MRDGDEITVCDGAGRWRSARFGDAVEPTGEIVTVARAAPPITIVFALVKGDRPEWVVQKLTELGVDTIVPLVAERSVVVWPRDRVAHQLDRLRRISREAAMQSRQCYLPEVAAPVSFADAVTARGVCLAHRGAAAPDLAHPTVLVGPEGGWSDCRARGRPAEGRSRARVLRAETAAVAAGVLLAALRVRPGARSRWVRSPSRSIAHRDRRRYGGRRTWGGAGQGRAQVARQGRGMTDERLSDDEPQSTAYGRKVGERLRSIRRQKRLSLQDVEATSVQEFKASVLGAYERGERAISVPRLQRLARFYNVPVDQLLPADEGPEFDSGDVIDLTDRRGDRGHEKVAIDLTRLDELRGPDAEMLARYLTMIQVQRQDFNGRVLTVRADDLRAIACILDVEADQASRRLDDLGLRLPRP